MRQVVPSAQPFGDLGASQFISTNVVPDGDMPRAIAMTPDGAQVLVVHRDTNNLSFFDLTSLSVTDAVDVGLFPVDVAVTPNGQLAVVPNVFDNTVSVISIASRTVLGNVPVSGDQPFRVAITPDSAFAVVGVINDAQTSAFSVIDLASLSEVSSFPCAGQGVIGGFFAPESGIFGNLFTQFALTADGASVILPDRANASVRIYDRASGIQQALIPTPSSPMGITVAPNGLEAVVSHEGGANAISVIDLTTKTLSTSYTFPYTVTNQLVRVTPDGAFAVIVSINTVRFVELATGATAATFLIGFIGDVGFSFDGQYAFIASDTAHIVDLAQLSTVAVITLGPCDETVLSPTELRAVALSNRTREDIQVYTIDPSNPVGEGRFLSGPAPEGDATRSLALTPAGDRIVALHNTSRGLSVLDSQTGALLGTVETGDRGLNVAVTPDGNYAVVTNGDSHDVSIVDLLTYTEVARLPTPARPTEVVISPDGSRAYVASISGTDRIHFIDLAGPASSVTGSLDVGQMGSVVYTFNVFSGLALSPDGSILAVCESFDDRLLLIDTATQTVLDSVNVGDFPIRALFSPDGSRVYVAHSFGDDIGVVNVASSILGGTIPQVEFALTLELDATGSYLYAGNFDQVGGAELIVVDTTDLSVVQAIPLPNPARALALSGLGDLYAVTTEGDLYVLSAAGPDTQIVSSVALTSEPSDLVLSDASGVLAVALPIPDGIDLALGPAMTQEFLRGDCNDDATFNIADAVFLLAVLFPLGPPPLPNCRDACDSNDDESLDISDAVGILSAQFGMPPTPLPDPFGTCGLDPADASNTLGCLATQGCP